MPIPETKRFIMPYPDLTKSSSIEQDMSENLRQLTYWINSVCPSGDDLFFVKKLGATTSSVTIPIPSEYFGLRIEVSAYNTSGSEQELQLQFNGDNNPRYNAMLMYISNGGAPAVFEANSANQAYVGETSNVVGSRSYSRISIAELNSRDLTSIIGISDVATYGADLRRREAIAFQYTPPSPTQITSLLFTSASGSFGSGSTFRAWGT